MTNHDIIKNAIQELSDLNSIEMVYHQKHKGFPMPSVEALKEIITLTRGIVFPGFFGNAAVNANSVQTHIQESVSKLHYQLTEQVLAGLGFDKDNDDDAAVLTQKADDIVVAFISKLPKIRETLATDVIAAYNGDPAAKSHGEIILSYPAIRAISNYRIAHELLLLNVPLIPRIITEMAHSETGIDIHPGAQIGPYFDIDHGTGVVIGETVIIGKNVKMYQGVTLGAKSFPLDEQGNPIKGIPRHPIIEDDVIIYSNASILGRITIGKGAVIGGNIWVDHDVPPGKKILQNNK
jgi:serine O-acetyltransferase